MTNSSQCTVVKGRWRSNGSWLARTAIAVLIGGCTIAGCQKTLPYPAKEITGVWNSTSPAYFQTLTDSCTGIYSVSDSVAIGTRWTIDFLVDNIVTIKVDQTSLGETVVAEDSCNAPRQYAFPETFRGIVGDTYMVVERAYYPADTLGLAYLQLGKFYYTDNSMTGDLTYLNCDTLHCRGYATRNSAIMLSR